MQHRMSTLPIVFSLLTAGLSGCVDNAVTLSCHEYVLTSEGARLDSLYAILLDQGVDPNAPKNLARLTQAVNNFCGTPPNSVTRNRDLPISEAVNWSSVSW